MIVHRYSEWHPEDQDPFDLKSLVESAQELMMRLGISFDEALRYLMKQGMAPKGLMEKTGTDALLKELLSRLEAAKQELRDKFGLDQVRAQGDESLRERASRAREAAEEAGLDASGDIRRALTRGDLLPLYRLDSFLARERGDKKAERAREALGRLRDALERWKPLMDFADEEGFEGSEQAGEEEARRLRAQFEAINDLLDRIREALESGDLSGLEPEALKEILGEEAAKVLGAKKEEMEQALTELLSQTGQVERDENDGLYKITPAAARKIGQRALDEIYSFLKTDGSGRHRASLPGEGTAETAKSQPWEFGDSLDRIDLPASLINALIREGSGVPMDIGTKSAEADAGSHPKSGSAKAEGGATSRFVRMTTRDMEVFETKGSARASVVMLLDMSGSMTRFGRFYNAKKLALALDQLMRTNFPEDRLHFVGFYTQARRYRVGDIPSLAPKDVTLMGSSVNLRVDFDKVQDRAVLERLPQHFTNLQRGLELSRRILATEESNNKTIFLVTDGLPTAYHQGSHLYLTYPPTEATLKASLQEVSRCTEDGIVINTFMMGNEVDGGYFGEQEFLERLAQLNKGRLFYPPPDKLTQFVLLDFVQHKKRLAQL